MPEDPSSKPSPVLGIKEIMEILPHRFPFLLLDQIIHIDVENNEITGIKNLTMNEAFFQGHFPDAPIMPGVLMLEALAQTGGILVHKKGFRKAAALLNMNHVKFRHPAKPGDVFVMHCKAEHLSNKGGRFSAKGMVEDKICVQAEIGFALVDVNQL
ncbi:MAG: 3-hydroxyacyl-ACP dehydratase FabZ [Chlamydiales bacterium]